MPEPKEPTQEQAADDSTAPINDEPGPTEPDQEKETAAAEPTDTPAAPTLTEDTTSNQEATTDIPDDLAPIAAEIESVLDARAKAKEERRAAFDAELAAGRPSADAPPPDAPSAGAPTEVPAIVTVDESSRYGPQASLAEFALAIERPRSPAPPVDAERHARCCTICSHPDRDAIDADYLNWHSPKKIARDYRLGSRQSVYRHVNATGLVRRRKGEVCRVIERYLEKVDSYTTEQFDQVTRAVRVYSHLGDDGRWVEPTRTHYNYSFIGQLVPDPRVPGQFRIEPQHTAVRSSNPPLAETQAPCPTEQETTGPRRWFRRKRETK